MRKLLSTIILVALLFVGTIIVDGGNVVYAADITSDTGWLAAYPNNNQNDYLQDQQTGSGSVSQDIVGDALNPSTYLRFSGTELDFRIRVSNINGTSPYEFKNFAFIGIDSDIDGSVDFFLGIYNPTGNNGRLGIYGADGSSLNISPSTTGIDGKPQTGFQPVDGTNYSISLAPGTSFNGDPDYYISFKFYVADISTALQGTGYTFTSSTPFRFMTGTAAQDNSFNQDLNGMDQDGWSSGDTWNDLGVFTDIVSPDGSAIYHTVTFDKNTGDTEADPILKAVADNDPLGTLPIEPEKRGMYFLEWNTLADGSGTTVTTGNVITADTTFYAIWTYNPPDGIHDQYTVTFDTDTGAFGDGDIIKDILSQTDGTVGSNMPTDPIDGTDLFVGWLAPDGTYFSKNTPVVSDITVTAQYTKINNNYRALFYDGMSAGGGDLVVTFASNGGSGSYGDPLPDIQRDGYVIDGWYSDAAYTTYVGAVGGSIPTYKGTAYYWAKWSAAPLGPYTVRYIENNEGSTTVLHTVVIINGMLGTLHTASPIAGYEFIEFNRVIDGSGEAMSPTSQILKNTDVYGIWKQLYPVTFFSNSGTFDGGAISWATTAVDRSITPPTVDMQLVEYPQPPFKTDYSFQGWSTSSSGTTPVDLTNLDYTTVNQLYAIWSPIRTVTFSENYGATPATQDVLTAYERVLYIPSDPTRTGYTFESWNTQADGKGTSFNIDTEVLIDTTVYAKWTSEVTFDANGGAYADASTTEGIQEHLGSNYVMPSANPTWTDYEFKEWNTLADGTGDTITSATAVAIDGAHTIYAIWSQFYNVTYVDNDGDASTDPPTDSNDYLEAATVTTASAITRPGYTFGGWNDGATTHAASSTFSMPASDVILTAQWTPNTNTAYTVVHYQQNANDSSYTIANTDNLTGTTDTTATAVAKTYVGFTENTVHAARVPSGNIAADGSLILRLYYDRDTYPLSYNANGGTGAPSGGTYKVGEQVTVGAAATRTGYTFAGWNDGTTTHNVGATFNMPSNAVTLTAVWTANTNTAYTVEHYFQDVTGSGYTIDNGETENLTGTTGATVNASAVTVTGFSENTTHASRIPSGTVAADGSLVLKLYYDRDTYTVSFDSHGGSAVSDITGVRYGATITAPTDPTRTGYDFAEWYKEAGYTNLWDFASDTVAASITLHADWTSDTATAYTVEHYFQDVTGSGYTIDNGETENLTGTTGTTVNASAVTVTGFIENTTHLSRVPSGTVAADGSLVLKLYYDRDTYTVSFDSHGGSTVSDMTGVRYGATIIAPTDPAQTGYDFAEWYKEAGYSNLWDFAPDTVTSTITLHADWTSDAATAYTVEHYQQNANDAGYTLAETDNETGTTGATATALANAYTDFTENTAHASRVPSGTILADGSLVLKLYYARDTYPLSYDANGGTGAPSGGTYKVGEQVTVGAAATRTGHTFAGWNDGTTTHSVGATFNMPSNAVTLTAVWIPDVIIPAIGIEVTPSEAIIYVPNTDGLINVLPLTATLTPDTATVPIVWTSSNPAVATVNAVTGVVTGVTVGRATITATAGTVSDISVIDVWSPEPDDPSLPTILVEGDIFYVNSEIPIPNVDITMYSTPLRDTTDVAGYFYLGYATEGPHTLIAETSPGVEVGRIPVTLIHGVSQTYILNIDGSLDITYTDDTERIFIRLMVPIPDGDPIPPVPTGGVVPRNVVFISGSISTGPTGEVTNPSTGDDMNFFENVWYSVTEFFKSIF